jgi:uncharacterized protein
LKTRSFAKIRDSLIAGLISIPIGLLGGLIGLGGAEFRLPVLIGVLKREAREAIPINLAVSLVTLASSLITRMRVISEFPVLDLLPILVSMILGAMFSAFFAAGVASKISSHILEKWMKLLLVSIGTLLIAEGFLPITGGNLIHSPIIYQCVIAASAGGLIGIVSSTLGVAGGELIIPTLIFIFGIGVKLAGTSSLIISIPTVCIGLYRYFRLKSLFDIQTFKTIIIPMGIGSIIGSIAGATLYGLFSPNILKAILGLILIFSSIRMFLTNRSGSIQ